MCEQVCVCVCVCVRACVCVCGIERERVIKLKVYASLTIFRLKVEHFFAEHWEKVIHAHKQMSAPEYFALLHTLMLLNPLWPGW